MQKISNYLGLKKHENDEPLEHSFSFPFIVFLAIPALLLVRMLLQWPEAGMPSELQPYNPQLVGGATWLATDGLPTWLVVFAWVLFFWRYVLYAAVSVILARLAYRFYREARFTRASAQSLRLPTLALSLGVLSYAILNSLYTFALERTLGLGSLAKDDYLLSFEYFLAMILMATFFMVNGALRGGAALQEENDSTI